MSKELAKKAESFELAILAQEESPAELLSAVAENLDGGRLAPWNLTRVRIPAGGATQWVVSELGEDISVKFLEGVVVAQRTTRVYYSASMEEGGGKAPDCKSEDGVTGVGNPGGACASCAMASWDEGRPRCKQQLELFLLRAEDIVPIVVVLSPASLKPWRQFVMELTKKAIPVYGARVRLSLVKEKNPQGVGYSKLAPEFVEALGKPERELVRGYRQALEAMLLSAPAPRAAQVVEAKVQPAKPAEVSATADELEAAASGKEMEW